MDEKHVGAEHSDELPALMEVNIYGALWAARRLQDGFLTYVLGVAAEHLAELQPETSIVSLAAQPSG